MRNQAFKQSVAALSKNHIATDATVIPLLIPFQFIQCY